MRTFLTSFLAAAALGGSLAAQEEGDLFSKLDKNRDGFVAGDEVAEEQKALFDRLVRKADKDSDKKLSKAEFQAGLAPDEATKQPLGGAGPGGGPGAGRPNPGEFFNRLDGNKDGKLTKEELPPGMQENFARLDGNSDAAVSLEEFGRGMAAMGRPPGAPGRPPGSPDAGPRDGKQLEELFDRTDANKDGKLTRDELGEDRREGFMRMLERSGGDSVTKEQFVRAMSMMAQAGGRPPGAPERRPDGSPNAGEPDRRPEGRGMPGGPGGPPRPFIAVIDTNQDGELSKDEIEGAGKALLALDKNSDGKLSREELFPGGPPPGPPGDRPREGRPGDPRPGDAGKGRPGDPRPGDAGKGRPPEGKAGAFSPEAFRDQLARADKDGDGKLSKEEAPERVKENFERLDANSDGFLDETERRQLFQRMQQGKGKRPDGNRPEGKRPDGEERSK